MSQDDRLWRDLIFQLLIALKQKAILNAPADTVRAKDWPMSISLHGDPPSRGRMTRLWNFWLDQLSGIRVVFGDGPHEKQLTLTFNFLSGLVGLLFVLTAIWAVAAGLLHTGQLEPQYATVFPAPDAAWLWWCMLPIRAVVYTGEAFGVALLVFLAAASVGAIAGFLFGVPRPISESGSTSASQAPAPPPQSPAGSAASPDPSSSQAIPATPGWQANTNLTQISDWLTKIMVGVGLVEASKVARVAISINAFVTASLFEGSSGVALAMPALMIAGLIFGFIYSYLFTQLFLATIMARTALAIRESVDLLREHPVASTVLNQITAADPVVAPMIQQPNSSAPIRPTPAGPTVIEQTAATNVLTVPLTNVNDADSLTVWARAAAVLNSWGLAAEGYNKLLSLRRTPDILVEAARVFASKQDITKARDLIREAVDGRAWATPRARARITFDAAHLALYDPPPEGYRQALKLLDPASLAMDDGGGLHVLHACATGQRFTQEAGTLTEQEKTELRQSILEDLRNALQYSANRSWILYLLGRDPQGAPRLVKAGDAVDDDLYPFKDDKDFLSLVGL